MIFGLEFETRQPREHFKVLLSVMVWAGLPPVDLMIFMVGGFAVASLMVWVAVEGGVIPEVSVVGAWATTAVLVIVPLMQQQTPH